MLSDEQKKRIKARKIKSNFKSINKYELELSYLYAHATDIVDCLKNGEDSNVYEHLNELNTMYMQDEKHHVPLSKSYNFGLDSEIYKCEEAPLDAEWPKLKLYKETFEQIEMLMAEERKNSQYLTGNYSLSRGSVFIHLPNEEPTVDFTILQLIETPWYYNNKTNFSNVVEKIQNIMDSHSKSECIEYPLNLRGEYLLRLLSAHRHISEINPKITLSDIINFLALSYCTSICKILAKRENYVDQEKEILPDVIAKRVINRDNGIDKDDYNDLQLITDAHVRDNSQDGVISWVVVAGDEILEADVECITNGAYYKADYQALIRGIEAAKKYCNPEKTDLYVTSSSELLNRQMMMGIYRVKARGLIELHNQLSMNLRVFKSATFHESMRDERYIRYCNSLCRLPFNRRTLTYVKSICAAP